MMIDVDLVAGIIRSVAEEEILPRYRTLAADDVREKSGPMDLVTVADIASEHALGRRLREAYPGTLVVGEEAATDDPSLLGLIAKDEPVWVLDPIDGTINFAHGRPGFGVIVAYVSAGSTIAGWIHDPLANVTVTAMRGDGAWRGPTRLKVSESISLNRMVGAAYGEIFGRGTARDVLSSSGKIGGLRNVMCGAIDYIEIAQRQKQFFLSPRSLPWDHAAGALIVTEAGGVARFLDGSDYEPCVSDRPILVSTDDDSWHGLRNLLMSTAARGRP